MSCLHSPWASIQPSDRERRIDWQAIRCPPTQQQKCLTPVPTKRGEVGGAVFPHPPPPRRPPEEKVVLPLSLGGLAPSDRAVSAGEEETDNGRQETHDFAGAANSSSFPASAAAAAAGVLPKFHYFSRGPGSSIFVGLRSLTHAPIGSSRSRHRSW